MKLKRINLLLDKWCKSIENEKLPVKFAELTTKR